jgi:hypothetical protein
LADGKVKIVCRAGEIPHLSSFLTACQNPCNT